MAKSQRVAAQKWVPTGNDYVIDGTWGVMGFSQNFGGTKLSGAINGLAVHEDQAAGKAYLYAGASNGGVYLRMYDNTSKQWEDTWKWVTKPGSGYEGSQSIGVLAVSEDGNYLAVAQGNPSNYAATAPPSRGVQIGRISRNGSITWLPVNPTAAKTLDGLDVRSLKWDGSTLIGTTWYYNKNGKEDPDTTSKGTQFSIQTSADGIESADVVDRGKEVLMLDHNKYGTLTAGYSTTDKSNLIELNGLALTGALYDQLLQELLDTYSTIGRVSLYPEPVNGRLVAFVGSFLNGDPNNSNSPIARVDRLEISPDHRMILDLKSKLLNDKEIGSNQATNTDSYGNFSFQADPYDQRALGVFAGGNTFLNDPTPTRSAGSGGGLVKIEFDGPAPTLVPLYGPFYTETTAQKPPFSPGQPHADSRTITFYSTSDGPALLQTDDGGIWELPLRISAEGATLRDGAWWQTLTTKGLGTLEMAMVGWNSHLNAILSSQQDNASSLGYYGEKHATNFDSGDGAIAFFDDAYSAGKSSAYMYGQWAVPNGKWTQVTFDRNGFARTKRTSNFYLQTTSGGVPKALAWEDTLEGPTVADEYGSETIIYKTTAAFRLPTEANAYKAGKIAMSGQFNIYETIEATPDLREKNGLLFRSLLDEDVPMVDKENHQPGLLSTAIDNQGGSSKTKIDSLYAGAVISQTVNDPNKRVVLFGRQSSNRASSYQLRELSFSNLSAEQITSAGQIQDIAHAPGSVGLDTIYWLQGGNNLNQLYASRTSKSQTPPSEQVLRVGQAGGAVITYNLVDDFGIRLAQGDQYGQQDLTYVPATKHHPAQLLIAGQQGIWVSEIGANGQPTGFTQMQWKGLPKDGPGSYVRSIQYDPEDDLLIAATQGQGSFLYSYSGSLGSRPESKRLLHVSNLDLHQSATPQLDKRGNQLDAGIVISLDSRLQKPDRPTRLVIELHKAEAWQRAMDYVSLYDFNKPNQEKTASWPGAQQMQTLFSITTTAGAQAVGGRIKDNTISVPLDMPHDTTMFAMTVNAKETDVQARIKPLKYTVSLKDGSESVTRRVRFVPLSSGDEATYGSRASLEAGDEITGLGGSQAALIDPSAEAGSVLPGRLTVTAANALDLVCGVYWVQGADGAVISADGELFRPGDQGYATAALRDANIAASFDQFTHAQSRSSGIGTAKGSYLAPFATLDGKTVFAFDLDAANGRNHFKAIAPGRIGLEDYASSGAIDFKDIFFTYNSVPLA